MRILKVIAPIHPISSMTVYTMIDVQEINDKSLPERAHHVDTNRVQWHDQVLT